MFAALHHARYLLNLASVDKIGQVGGHASRAKTVVAAQRDLQLHGLQTNHACLLRQCYPINEAFHKEIEVLEVTGRLYLF